MFIKDLSYFPTLREIRDELIKAQIDQVRQYSESWDDDTNFKALSSIYANNWIMLFEIANLGDLDKPLTRKILSNPIHNVTKHILYLYSMESFIYGELNQASRMKDESKI